jgi:multidrug efflux pump
MYGSMLSSFWVPLSQAIVSGLTFATMLTLVTTPAMLAIPHQLKALRNRYFKSKEDPDINTATAAFNVK